MATDVHPTINDFLARIYTIRDEATERAREEAKAIIARNAARGLLRSGATLKALAELIEIKLDAAITEITATLHHMRSFPEIDYQACRDQAFLRARDLVSALRSACELDKWLDMIDRGAAGDIINRRVEALLPKIDYRFRQFDVGLDRVIAMRPEAESPTNPADNIRQVDRFDVALSFAGERRDYVRGVAKSLKAMNISVFYDEFEETNLWDKNGADHFHQIYSKDANYVVIFISSEYISKAWTRHELQAAISRQMKGTGEYILPVRFDDADVPGIADTMQYLLAERFTPDRLAIVIAKKIGFESRAQEFEDEILKLENSHKNISPTKSLNWRPAAIGVRAKLYLEVESGDAKKFMAAVRKAGGVQSVDLDRVGASRSVIAIALPASAEPVQRSIADRAIEVALQIDPTIGLL